MLRTVGLLLSGEPGMGKTLTGLSFTKEQGETIRIVTDMEGRAWMYQAPKDIPEKLKYAFYYWPQPGRRFDTAQLLDFYEGLCNGEVKAWSSELQEVTISPDVWIIDNVMLFQRQMQRVAGKQKNAIAITKAMDLVGFGMLLQYWRSPDPGWWNLLKSVIGELLLAARTNGVSVIATTEVGNQWADYGKKRTATCEGQRVLGKTAKALVVWRQLLDAVWMFDRTVPGSHGQTTLKQMPTISTDLFNPKGSLVGIPPKFEWAGWDQFWILLDMGEPGTDFSEIVQETQLPTPEELEEAEAARQAVEEPELDAGLKLEAFLQYAVDELGFENHAEVKTALKKAGFTSYEASREKEMWAALEQARR